jgi:hypothetical protein
MRGVTAGLTQLLAGLLASTALFAVPAVAAVATAAPTVVAAATAKVIVGGACNGVPGAYQLPGSGNITPAAYSDAGLVVPACGPRGSQVRTPVNPYPGSLTTAGYQCVEFSRRYLYYKYGAIYNYSTNGDQVVDHYAKAYPTFFTVVPNGTVRKAPVPGDVMSFSTVSSFHSSSGGHTAVVQASSVGSTGTGTITLIEENNSASGVLVLPITAWKVSFGNFTYIKWLHAKSNTKVPTTPPSATDDGNFVSYSGNVYRIAGHAPIYVSNWSAFGGPKPTTALTAAQWASLASVPADGTLVSSARTAQVYRIAGGAPVFVASWASLGAGVRPTIAVDPAALDRAGTGGQFLHLRARPADGTLVEGAQTKMVYRFAGGAPLYVPAASLPATASPTPVDQAALDNAGQGGQWDHVSYRPADGTFLIAGSTYYRVAGGAALRITSCTPAALQRCAGAAVVDPTVLSHAGLWAPWSHLLATVPNDTFVRVADGNNAGQFARAVGGALLTVPSCTAAVLDGCPGAVVVNQGSVAAYAVAHPRVADGTYLRLADGSSSGQVAVAAGGALLDLSGCSLAALKGCPGQVAMDAASFDLYAAAHPIPVAGTAVRALDSGVSYSFASNCRQVAGTTTAAVGVVSGALGSYPNCVAVKTTSVPSGLAGVSYRTAVSATGGTGSYTYTVTSGRLPAGWTLAASTGVLSGVTRQSGTSSFVVTVADVVNPTVRAQRTFWVTVAPMTIRNAPTLAAGKRAQVYKQQLLFSGGAGTHVFRLVAGHLPPGLTLSASGVISGRPTKAGTYHAGISLTDASRPVLSTMKVFAITIR